MDAKIQSRQALQVGQLILWVLFGGGPATTHHTAGVNPAGMLDAAAPLGLQVGSHGSETVNHHVSYMHIAH